MIQISREYLCSFFSVVLICNLFCFVVINLALPGIDVYLQETLSREGLSEEGEKLRRKYVGMLTSGSPPDKLSEQNGYKEGSEEEDTEVSKTFTHLRNQPISDDCDDETAVNRTSGLYDLPACSDTKLHTVEKVGNVVFLHTLSVYFGDFTVF